MIIYFRYHRKSLDFVTFLRSKDMVARTVCLCLVASLFLAVSAAFAAHGGPMPTAAPLMVPVYGSPPPPRAFGPGAMPGPAMAAPRVMGPAPCAPPMCAPPACGPASCEGFNPLSALVSIVTLPFRVIGGAVSALRPCPQPTCMPAGYVPMAPPSCGPPMNVGPTKCRPGLASRTNYGYAPMQ